MKIENNISDPIANFDEDVIDFLSKITLFNGFEKNLLSKTLRGTKKKTEAAHKKVWEYSKSLKLTVVSSGCLAVRDGTDDEIAIDALISPGQLVGEFELLDFESTNQSLVTMRDNTVLIELDRSSIDKIAEKEPILFYRNLAKTLVAKLRIENNWIKVRGKQSVVARLAMLLSLFKLPEWNKMINPVEENKNYDIEVFWSVKILCQCLSTQVRSLCDAFNIMFNKEVINVYGCENLDGEKEINNSFFTGQSVEDEDAPFKIRILDQEKLERLKKYKKGKKNKNL